MTKTDSCLIFSENYYDIFGNQSIHTLSVTDSNDKNFQFQFRYSHEKSKKIDFSILKDYLEENVDSIYQKRILVYPGYKAGKMDKTARTNKLFNLFPKIQHAEFIYNKNIFRKDIGENEKLDSNLINFFKIASFQEKTIQVGYEIPETNITDTIPNCYMYFIEEKKPTKKIHLFPYATESLQVLLNEKAMREFPTNSEKLKILFYEEKLGENAPHNIYSRLLETISETLQHLEKPKIFGKGGVDKIAIFKELSKMISNKEPLENIKDFLNSSDKVETLSKHRDPWRFFVLLQGETYSTRQWKILEGKVSEQKTNQPSIVNRLS
ncbi:MAG: hypothetical protein WAL30_01640 [Candidatus Aquirickettsiella sp.]